MIKKVLYYIIWAVIVIVLIFYTIKYKGGSEAMIAQVENEVTAISFHKPVLVRNIYISPGQVVDSGELLLEVERPDLKLDMDRKIKEKLLAEKSKKDSRILYDNSIKILTNQYKGEEQVLINQKEELMYQSQMDEKSRQQLDGKSILSYYPPDSIRFRQIQLIDEQLMKLEYEFSLKKQQLLYSLQNNIFKCNSELTIIDKEISELSLEQSQLQKRAEKRCTIGNLFVQLNELVPPYKTLLSIYDINPTLIKAFVHESVVEDIRIGAKVIVVSVNRKYKIEGQIIEIGSRITSYPDKINPLINQASYGQEIFINIPDANNFLNGEKVYVYLLEDES